MADELTEQQKTCKHEAHTIETKVSFLEDTGFWYADFHLTCSQCDLPFHFISPDYGLLRDRPALNPDGTELRCPIAPGRGVLPPEGMTMRFEMPTVKPKES